MKKIIKFIVIFILILICIIMIQEVDEVSYNLDSKLIVCLDAGHGGIDVGAINDERLEKDDTLKVTQLVKKHLEDNNIKVIMTRDNDSNVSLKQRCIIANRKKADIFVSIHRNSAEIGNGVEIWTNSKQQTEDLDLANSIMEKLDDTEIQSNRGVKSGTAKGENTDYYVLNNANMTSCLIELGFITDNKDNELFDKHIEEYAKAIANGIIEEIKDE